MRRNIYTSLFLLATSFCGISQSLIAHVEAETAQLTGLEVHAGGNGPASAYVTGFDADGDRLNFEVKMSRKAVYRLYISYRATQTRVQDLYINNDLVANLCFPQSNSFTKLDLGGVLLQSGINTVTLQKKGGYVDIDKFDFYTTEQHTYEVSPALINPQASLAAQNLYDYMRSQYGHNIISGQTDSRYNSIKELTGQSPMLIAFDMASYSPQYAFKTDSVNGGHMFGSVNLNVMERAIAWYQNTRNRGIVSLQWHWFSPSGGTVSTNTFSVENTTFDVSKAVMEGTEEYGLIIRDIDAIAVQLKKLDKANIPVLWRPLHEACSAKYWWGAKGAHVAKALYDLMYERLTRHHQLNNLIWVWASPEADWYPGNDKVDIIGFDSYPGAFIHTSQKAQFDLLFDIVKGEKLIALCENGPIPNIKDCIEADAHWSYFMSWSDLVYSENMEEHIKEVYAHPSVITLESMSNRTITEVSDYESDMDVNVYPNPTKDYIRLSRLQGVEQIAIYSAEGILKQNWKGDVREMSLEDLSKGAYLIKIYTAGQVHVRTLIKD